MVTEDDIRKYLDDQLEAQKPDRYTPIMWCDLSGLRLVYVSGPADLGLSLAQNKVSYESVVSKMLALNSLTIGRPYESRLANHEPFPLFDDSTDCQAFIPAMILKKLVSAYSKGSSGVNAEGLRRSFGLTKDEFQAALIYCIKSEVVCLTKTGFLWLAVAFDDVFGVDASKLPDLTVSIEELL